MRLVRFISVCFAASTAVNSTQSNYSGARDEVDKSIANAGLPPNNLSLTVDQPDWCTKLEDQPIEEVLANCKILTPRWLISISKPYVLRINKDVTEVAWNNFIENAIRINTDVEVIDSSLTELIMTASFGQTKLIISNNLKLERIVIKGKSGIQIKMGSSLEVKGNPVLKSIKLEAEQYSGAGLTISENDELETVDMNVTRWLSGFGKHDYTISNNPKLRRIQMNVETTMLIRSPLYIVGNKALTELKLPETIRKFHVKEIHINDNDNLETIKFPESTSEFEVNKLEIRQNYKLNTIVVRNETRWNETELIIRENPRLSPETLETLKKIQWKSKDIQEVGEETAATTTDINLIDSSMPELVVVVDYTVEKKIIIENNQKLERIIIKAKKGTDLRISLLGIKGNPALKSIRIEAEKYHTSGLTIVENNGLETIQFNVPDFHPGKHLFQWAVSKNPKLRRIQLKNCKKFWIHVKFYIIENKALTELDFPKTMKELSLVQGLYINDNDNLEAIKFPETSYKLWLPKLEIRQNDKLKTIDLGEQTRWKSTHAVVRENPLLSSETLEALKTIEWARKDIQAAGERELTTTTTTTTAPPPPPVNPVPAKPAPVVPAPVDPINPDEDWNRPPEDPADSSGLSTFAIMGLVFLGLMIFGCVGCCVCCCWRRSAGGKKKAKKVRGKAKKKEESPKKEDKSKTEESSKESPTDGESPV